MGDTLPNHDFSLGDPSRKQPYFDYANLGNIGTAAQPLWYRATPRLGFDVGSHVFDIYKLSGSQLRFYRHTRTMSDVSYVNGRLQTEGIMNVRYSRTFSDKINFSFEYRNINHLGQYEFQRTKHNAISFGLWIPRGTHYDAFLTYTRNTHQQEENGGVPYGTEVGEGAFTGAINLPIRLANQTANTRHSGWELQLYQYLRLLGKENGRNLRLEHTFTWNKNDYKFYDRLSENTSAGDSSVYGRFYTEARGLRHFLEAKQIQNTFSIATLRAKDKLYSKDYFAAGILHNYTQLYQEPQQNNFHQLFLTGEAALHPSNAFDLKATGALGLLKNIGEYRVQAQAKVSLARFGALHLRLLNQRMPATALQQQVFISGQSVWQNNFDKIFETSLAAGYGLPKLGLEIEASAHLVNNYIWYDSTGLPRQSGSALQINQLYLQEQLKWRWLRCNIGFGLQNNNNTDVIQLPEWLAKATIYYENRLFKKNLLLHAGVDVRTNSAFYAGGYQPAIWQYTYQNQRKYETYPWMDVFISFKVSNFRAFFRYENLSTIWDNKLNYYTDYYPQALGQLRLGIGWRFSDKK